MASRWPLQGRVSWRAGGALLAAALLVAVPAAAQPAPPILPIPRILPDARPQVSRPAPTAPRASAGPTDPSEVITVREAAVEGVTAYPDGTWAGQTASLVGRSTRGQIDAVRRAILERYRADGYQLTGIAVRTDAGRVRFVVSEGHIAEVKLEGDIGPAGTQVLRFLNKVTETDLGPTGKPLPIDAATLERALLLAQDVAGVSVRAVLRPSTDTPGALTLVAVVSRKPFNFLLVADNRGSPFTGPEGALLAVDGNSFTEFGERTTVSLFRAPNNTQIFGQVASEVFVGGSGLRIRLFAGSGTADPSGALRSNFYHSITTNAGITALYPVIRSRQQTLIAYGTMELLDNRINTGKPASQASRDNLRMLRFGADYARQDVWLGDARPAVNQASVRLTRGLPFAGASRSSIPAVGRQNQVVEFTKVNFDITRTQTLFQPWDGVSVALQGTLAGQFSNDILPSAEKYYLGGARLNRGYYAGEVTGDRALSASVELQVSTSFPLELQGTPIEVDSTFYTFYDWGETVENQRTDPNRRLHSWGGGVRLKFNPAVSLDLEGVHRMVRKPLGATANTAPLRGDAFYWRLVTRF